ncbi:PREDICTED: WW domain-binding protein 4 isoform X2 [Eufriesea mexicana]|uniref:WW domain-binding protein 4 isoform X2 n=1 Tax=Eufriesea mexicana TaxID=516756 RepID=UPI00083C88CB|nr:PREDICTED: WW domain-binding protein 4 isoform X2 [Eufriesea mexicana]
MADYWKSQGRKFCDFCKCWIADNKPSIDFHEGGKKHKENVSKRLKEIHKNSAKQAKQTKKIEDDIKKMENAAMIAYLKDVENNTRDMTADRIIKEKMTQIEAKDVSYFDHITTATSGAQFRFKAENQQEIDPCDPTLVRNITAQQMKSQHKGDSKSQGKKKKGKSKTGKGKGKGKKILEEERPAKPVRKLWYEALSPEGYTYYWHIENNESVWNPPEDGYMTFAEQQEEAKEQALQEELLKQLDKEEAIAKADILEEKRANAEREKLKKLRKMSSAQLPQLEVEQNIKEEMQVGTETESRPYRRDYSIPVKSHPYGPWQTVQKTQVKPLDFQLPQQNQLQIQLPVSKKTESQSFQRIFKEKTITQIEIPDINEGNQPIAFKKRKISNRNVRQRFTDDS